MNKLVCGVFAAMLIAGCSGVPGTGSPTPTLPGANDALTQLCSATGDASLTGLANRLDEFDPATMDPATFQVAAGAVAATLTTLQVSGEQIILRDAAVTAVQSVQGANVDKSTTTQAAVALRTLETAIC